MTTLKKEEVEKGLEVLEYLDQKLSTYLNLPGRDDRIIAFIRGTLKEYRFHLLFNLVGVFASDIDFAIRGPDGKVVCLLECKELKGLTLPVDQARALVDMAERLQVPLVFVRYSPDLQRFWVSQVKRHSNSVIQEDLTRPGGISFSDFREMVRDLAGGKDPETFWKKQPLEVLH